MSRVDVRPGCTAGLDEAAVRPPPIVVVPAGVLDTVAVETIKPQQLQQQKDQASGGIPRSFRP